MCKSSAIKEWRNCVLLFLGIVENWLFPFGGMGKVSTEAKVTYIFLYTLQILQVLMSLKNHMSLYLICVMTFT